MCRLCFKHFGFAYYSKIEIGVYWTEWMNECAHASNICHHKIYTWYAGHWQLSLWVECEHVEHKCKTLFQMNWWWFGVIFQMVLAALQIFKSVSFFIFYTDCIKCYLECCCTAAQHIVIVYIYIGYGVLIYEDDNNCRHFEMKAEYWYSWATDGWCQRSFDHLHWSQFSWTHRCTIHSTLIAHRPKPFANRKLIDANTYRIKITHIRQRRLLVIIVIAAVAFHLI